VKDELEVVHLNGTLEDLPDNVTFSLAQYAERLAQEQPWYRQLATDLLSQPVVFVGTQLDEPQMWQHVEKRRSKGGRAESELRPRSYLVTTSLNKARQACLSDFHITLLDGTAEEFAREVLEPLAAKADVGQQFLKGLSQDAAPRQAELLEVADLAVKPDQSSEFLFGAEPIWADIQTGRAIERESDTHLWSTITDALKNTGTKGYILITGTAGNGKGTALKRAALKLSSMGHRVAWVDQFADTAPYTIKKGMIGNDPPKILMIDDADIYGAELGSIIREVGLHHENPLVVLAIRSGRVDRVINPAQLQRIPKVEIAIPGLTDSDIDGLIDVLQREKRLGALAGKSRLEMQDIFRQKCGRQLLVAMIEATSGAPFEKKITDELDQLEAEAQRVYAAVCVATALRFYLTRNEILLAIGDVTNKVLNAMQRLASRQIILAVEKEIYQARHRVIADVVFNKLISSGELAEVLCGLAMASASQITPATPSSARPRRLLQRITNHEFLLGAVGPDEARNLYGELEGLLQGDFNFWLQRGCLELECGSLNFAENCLNYALSLNSTDHNTQTEYAHLLFRKALANPSGLNSGHLVEEATKYLTANIAARGDKDPHSYHVLGSDTLQWIVKGIHSHDEQKIAMENLKKTVGEGLRKHPKNDLLKNLEAIS
jgi:hypothetical protein